MKAFVIAIPDHEVSQRAADICIDSSKVVGNSFEIQRFDAIVPRQVNKMMRDYRLEWNYPWEGSVFDFKTGLKKTAYPTVNRQARIACSLSHYNLWKNCYNDAEPYLILEHDSKFISRLDNNVFENERFFIIGINNPLFATRKANLFKQLIDDNSKEIQPVPNIDSFEVPQGLAGNSAYIIMPKGARQMLRLVEDHGLWPNDAIMCKQLIPSLGVTKKFYTEVQGTPSTTSR